MPSPRWAGQHMAEYRPVPGGTPAALPPGSGALMGPTAHPDGRTATMIGTLAHAQRERACLVAGEEGAGRMSEQVRPATASGAPGVEGYGGGLEATGSAQAAPFVSQVPGTPVSFPSYHGRPVSWVAVTLIIIGFVVGGLALVFGPTWGVFW